MNQQFVLILKRFEEDEIINVLKNNKLRMIIFFFVREVKNYPNLNIF